MFSDTLKLQLNLTINSDIFNIPGGNIKNCQLNLYAYGFEGKLDFWISSASVKDPLFSKFIKPDLVEMRLSIQGVYDLPSPAPEPLVIVGIVTKKSVREITYKDVSGNPVLQRHYEIFFKDAPQVLWKQHFPTELYIEKKMADILKANAMEGISLEMEWDVLQRKQAVTCLGLGNDLNEASFYDFLMWYVKCYNGVCTYNYKTQFLKLSNRKTTEKSSITFHPEEIDDLCIHMPETCRQNIRILNAYSDSPKKIEVTQDQAVSGTSKDIILRTEIVKELDMRKNLEASKLRYRQHEIEIGLKQFPAKTFRIGSMVKFESEEWSDKTFYQKKAYRVHEIRLTANAKEQGADHDYNAEFTIYDMVMTTRMEYEDNPAVMLPHFKTPYYPIRVEGKIVSLAGKPTDKTYQIYSNPKTSQDYYSVFIPLWNSPVMVPFTPDITTGHFFFPAFTNSRVLLDVYYDRAEITDFLDWGEGTRLTMDSQGNHILFGKSEASETSIKYVYKDNKPLFNIQRVWGTDTELIQMEDGGIIIETKEDESREKVADTFDLTPKVAAAGAQLAMEKESSISGVTGSFESTKSEVTGKIDGALAETKEQLETMDSEVSGKVEEIGEDVKSAMGKLSETSREMKSASESAKKDLKESMEF
jgi:hypothetical protein